MGGNHYQKGSVQHWDMAAAAQLDYFQGQITKYVGRWRDKNGIQDLEKGLHFLDKYLEVDRWKDRIKDDDKTEEIFWQWAKNADLDPEQSKICFCIVFYAEENDLILAKAELEAYIEAVRPYAK